MEEKSVTHGTFVIERSFAAAPERVFAAFSDAETKRRWFADGRSMDLEQHELDFRAGGVEITRSRFKEGSPFPGLAMINHTAYLDIVDGRRIVMAYTMTIGERQISASLATFEMLPAGTGTTLVFTEQGAFFTGSDGAAMREQGWGKLLDRLAEAL